MKRNWIRKVAVLLSLCLILNSGFLDLAGYVYAAEGTSAPNSTVQSTEITNDISSSTGENETNTSDVENPEEPANDGSNVEDTSDDDTNGTIGGNSDNNGGVLNGGIGTTTTTTESTTSVEGTTTPGETENNTENNTGETETEESETEETTTEEETTEEETTEEETTEEMPVMMMSARSAEVSVPADADEFLAKVSASGNIISVYTWQDMINIQNLCNNPTSYAKVNGFKDITFMIQIPTDVPSGQQYWDSTQGAASGFTGIGNASCQFKGTMKGAFSYTSGTTHLELDRPLFSCIGEGATFSNMKIVAKGCSSPIADRIAGGKITLSDLAISGTIGMKEDGTRASQGGTFAGQILGRTTLSVSNVTSTADIIATEAGALAGRCSGQLSIEGLDGYIIGDSGAPITVYGTYAAGGLFGIIYRTHSIDLKIFNYVSVDVIGNGGSANAGYLFGIVNGRSEAANITLTGSNKITVNIGTDTSGTCAGGLIGWADSNVTLLLPEDGFTIDGTINAGGQIAGGVIGKFENSTMEITPVTIADTATISGYKVGGILGLVNNSKIIIDTPTVNGALTATGGVGGILAQVNSGCAVELQGTVTVVDRMAGKESIGSVAAQQDGALIYLHGIEGKINDVSQLNIPMTDALPKYNDVYTYGGVFRNQDMSHRGSGVLLIGDGTLANVGVVNNEIVDGKLGESGTIDAAADLETFAIANFSNGNFGLSAFTGKISTQDILDDPYTLHNNADISYEKTGIITLNRNADAVNNEQYSFKGSLSGVNESITITQNNALFQRYVGVFASLAGDTTFKNLIINGTVTRSSYVGGLAYRTTGTSLTLKNIKMQKDFSSLSHEIGGILVREDGSSRFILNAENVTLASKMTAGGLSEFSGLITTMDNADISLTDITLGGKMSNSAGTAGGFLGKTWKRVGGTVTNVSVESGTTYQTNGVFGGLVHTITNQDDEDASKLTLKNVGLAGLSVSMGGQGDCGLLVHNGQLLILDVIDYSAAGVNITGASADFDELVGYTNIRNVGTFGVVSIHNTAQSFSGSTGYHYKKQATYTGTVPTANADTRYYYDVFQKIENEDGTAKVQVAKSGSAVTISSPVDYFIVDIVQCCDKEDGYGQLTKYFKKFFTDNDTPSNYGTYSLQADLNLTDYSVYPMPRQGNFTLLGKGHRITFAAAGMENWELPNVEKNSLKYQHYQLHCGLLMSTYEASIIFDDIILSGSIGHVSPYHCGALVAGSLSGSAKITNITLDGLYISSYGEDSSKNGSSLLVGYISDPGSDDAIKVVNFDYIKMTGYKENPYSDEKWAAASLIGAVGDKNANGIAIKFTNMTIEDELESTGAKYGKYLKYSSFIYNYEYTDDSDINKGSGLYLFTEADEAAGRVTYGAELDYDTEYYDTANKVLAESAEAPEKVWIPYVYREKQIEVNPKSGDILRGCGTYEDPYIIESAKQFLTLYRYVNEPEKADTEDYQYQTFYKGWKVILTGTDANDDFCGNKKHEAALATAATAASAITRTVTVDEIEYSFTGTGGTDARVFGESDFPTPDQLSQAYYQLDEDIDLSGITKGTYAQIAQEFVGFGTLDRPFTGVWYGKDPENGAIHTVTLPDKKSDAIYGAYGFIQYAKGAVVKDLVLATTNSFANSTYALTNITNASSTGVAGSVFAYIVGGDNVIDNVTTSVRFRTTGHSIIGGYVGIIKKGGLILRNVTDASIKNFRILSSWKGAGALWAGITGKVEDGYILYEGSGSTDYVINSDYAIVGNTWSEDCESVSAVPNYSIINGSKLKSDAGQNGGIQITVADRDGSATEKNVTITIPNAAALQVMAMAMNADALNVCPANYQLYSDNNMHWGYAEDSRSRKASYNDIGCTTKTKEYLAAVKYDNMNGYTNATYTAEKSFAYPYLYQYMGITEERYLTVTNGHYAVLNLSQSANQTTYHVTWELAEESTYDLSVYEEGFQGIGSLYYPAGYQSIASTFRGDLNGNGSTIIYDITRRLYWDYDKWSKPSESQHHAGLFNILATPVNDTETKGIYNNSYDFCGLDGIALVRPCFTIQNVNVKGNVDVVAVGESLTDKKSYFAYYGGIVGEVYSGNYAFENISTPISSPMQIEENNNFLWDVGGIAGRITNNASYILFKDCHWKGTEENKVKLYADQFVGSLVGLSDGKMLKIVDCTGEYLDIKSAEQNAGGLLGHVGKQANYQLIVIGSETQQNDVAVSTPVSVKNSRVIGYFQAGALIGESRCSSQIYNVYSEDNTIGSLKSMGGIIGELGHYSVATSSIEKAVVKNLVVNENYHYMKHLAGIGGVVGASVHTLTIQDAEVTGDTGLGTYNCKIVGSNNKSRTGNTGVGGIIGVKTSKQLSLENCSVTNVHISGDAAYVAANPAFIGVGGLCGYNESAIILKGDNVVSGCRIETQLATESSNEVLAAGGCFGLVRGRIGASANSSLTYYEGLSATKNTVIGKYAGGLIGRLDVYTVKNSDNTYSTYGGELRLQAVQVTNGTVTSDETAGGLIGYAQPGGNGFAFNGAGVTSADKANLISDMTITGRAAGGVYGYYNQVGPSARSENLMIQNSKIIATAADEETMRSAGGFIGECKLASPSCRLYSFEMKNCMVVAETSTENVSSIEILSNYAAGGILGRMVTDSKNGDIRCDNIKIRTDNRIGVCVKDDESDAAVKLVMKDGTLVSAVVKPTVDSLTNGLGADPETGVTVTPKNYDAIESLVSEYGYCVGTFIGTMDSIVAQVYVMCSNDSTEEFTIPVMDYNSPVTDVGVSATTQLDETDSSYYRKGAHIIYGAPVTERDKHMASDPFKNVDYMNSCVEEVSAEYTDEMTLAALLKNYRLSSDAVELFKNSYAESYTFPGSANTVESILVYKPQNGTIQEVMETLTDVMTNTAGASASDMKILKITCTQKLVNGDTTTDGDNPSITATVTDGMAEYTYVHEDGLVGNEQAMSYTELTYTYSCENGHQKIFSLPIFVEEPVYYGVHMKILEGSVTSVADIKKNGLLGSENGTRVVIANDSDYTLLMEYTYGKAREKMPDEVAAEKSFILKDADGLKELPIGTKLRLIDVTHGNIPYYYMVETEGITELKFSEFKDSAGKPYVNQPLNSLVSEGETSETDENTVIYTDLAGHTLTNTGVERYLLTVFNAETDNKGYQIRTNMVPQILNADGMEDTEASESAKTQFSPEEEHENMPWFLAIAVPGLNITLQTEENKTDIDGAISKEDSLTVKATILLDGDYLYWEYMNQDGLDSENNGKFLEIAFYLRDGGRINLPQGTNISIVTTDSEGNKTYSDNQIIQDNTVIYYYKDILENPQLIDDITSSANKQDITIPVEFVLNFAGADLSEFTSGSYEACIELLRTADSEYPMGSGNSLEIYSEVVQAEAANNLGFAIKSKKLEQLAINTYPTANPDGNKIDYQTMFDFSDILEKISGVGEDAALEKWAGFDYEVTYTLYQKQKQTVDGVETISYVKYTSDDIAVSVEGAESTTQRAFATDGYVGVTATYRFGADEIKKGTSVEGAVQQDGLIIRDGSMELATANLISASQENLTNYKIVATMKIVDSSQVDNGEGENADADSELTTEDFFVFTVTKLKTDLSE